MYSEELLKEAVKRRISNMNELEKQAFIGAAGNHMLGVLGKGLWSGAKAGAGGLKTAGQGLANATGMSKLYGKMTAPTQGLPGAFGRAKQNMSRRWGQIGENQKHLTGMGRAETVANRAQANQTNIMNQGAKQESRLGNMAADRRLVQEQHMGANRVKNVMNENPQLHDQYAALKSNPIMTPQRPPPAQGLAPRTPPPGAAGAQVPIGPQGIQPPPSMNVKATPRPGPNNRDLPPEALGPVKAAPKRPPDLPPAQAATTSTGIVQDPNITSTAQGRIARIMTSTPAQIAMYAGASPALEAANRAAAGVPPLNYNPPNTTWLSR